MSALKAASPNNPSLTFPINGSCYCKKTTFRVTAPPLRIHCCHCLFCQARSGSAFATNMVIERKHVEVTSPSEPSIFKNEAGACTTYCGNCHNLLWSYGPGLGPEVVFLRVGMLEQFKDMKPDLHVFTRSKADWLTLPEGSLTFEAGSPPDAPGAWSDEAKRRLDVVLGRA